jgi:Effector-associated domain 9
MPDKTGLDTKARIVRIVVASPGDVQAERDAVELVATELNRDLAADRKMVLRVIRWETDASPGFHPEGGQALIDSVLKIEDCDLLVGIFWKKFGTPVMKARSGTEHEIKQAYKSWKKRGRPQIFIYFNQKPFEPVTKAEKDQWKGVQEFKASFPAEGLWWKYKGAKNLTSLLRTHLTRWILQATPSGTSAKPRTASASKSSKKSPARNTVSSSFLQVKLDALRVRRVALTEDYADANNQFLRTLSEVDRNRLRRQTASLESEIGEIEKEIAELEHES